MPASFQSPVQGESFPLPALLHGVDDRGQQGEQPQQGERSQHPGGCDLAYGFDGREARPRVHEDQAPRHDAEQRAQGVGPKRQSRDPARQVDQEEGECRDQPQEEKKIFLI